MIPAPAPEAKSNLRFWYKALRKRFMAKLPYIKRKRHTQLRLQLEQVTNLFLALPSLATETPYTSLAPLSRTHAEELCLFVSYAPEPRLKPHVIDHMQALLNAGIAVVLIINTPFQSHQFELPESLATRLHGCLLRENLGFDFAGWAQAFCLLDPSRIGQRLYLINDSIVGPLDHSAYQRLIQQVRRARADLLGLTSNSEPAPHLQSFFLVVNSRLLRSPAWTVFMRGVLNLPTKKHVIDLYEKQLSAYLSASGFECAALFPSLAPDPFRGDDTLFNWARLIEQGFPFIKASVLEVSRETPEAMRLVPSQYREIANSALRQSGLRLSGG